ncbi:MAG: HTH domain-containing protein [Halanaerobiales bacterium]
MKIDRLLGIIMYLLNREIVSASKLAEEFNVSVRTIQRDINSLTMAGIPIVSHYGSTGGYGIIDNFKLDKQIMNRDDYLYIIKALEGLLSAYESEQIKNPLEKIKAIIPEQEEVDMEEVGSRLSIDFSVQNFPNGKFSEGENESTILELSLPEEERHWFGVLLSYGNRVKVLEPASLRKKILQHVKEIEGLYENR